jgi:hypothetical protein
VANPACRDHVVGHDRTTEVALEGQQQVLRATFPGIRDGVRELLGVRADALARKFHETHDMTVKDELERLLREYGKLNESYRNKELRLSGNCHERTKRSKADNCVSFGPIDFG